MPKTSKTPATGGQSHLPFAQQRSADGKLPKPTGGHWQRIRRPGGKGGKPPRFPGRTGGR